MGKKASQPEERREFDGVIRRSLNFTARALDPATRSFEVIASTASIDSHGDIVEQDWNLERYLKNPLVLWNHNNFESSGWSMGGTMDPEDCLPVGKASNVRVDGGQLVATLSLVQATEEQEPFIAKLWRRIEQGIQRAVSVGFYPGNVTEELAPGGTLYRLGNCELLEISLVPIPSNPDAVAKSIAIEREHLARMAGVKPAKAERTEQTMTIEEKAAYEAAQADAKSHRERAEKAERELAAEKSNSVKLAADLEATSKRAKAAEDKLIEQEIGALVGKKLTPAEKDEEIALAKEIGLERVLKRLNTRPDIAITAPVQVEGEAVSDKSKAAPPPADGGDASADIAKAAEAAARAA